MEVVLLGTGDTTGTPTVGCDCGTCRRALIEGLERSRFCVHVRNDRTDESVLIDTSPDFRSQFLEHGVPLPEAIVVTHIHFDHLDGLGNTYRLYRASDPVDVYAAAAVDPVTGESVADTVRRKYDYLDRIRVHDVVPAESFEVCGLDVSLVPVDHPPLLSFGLVVEDPATGGRLGLTGDTSFAVPAASKRALAGADLLLADALVPAAWCAEQGKGSHHGPDGLPRTFGGKHMTREGALELADELDAAAIRLVHCSHFYPPGEAFEDPLAVDGERFRI